MNIDVYICLKFRNIYGCTSTQILGLKYISKSLKLFFLFLVEALCDQIKKQFLFNFPKKTAYRKQCGSLCFGDVAVRLE